MCYVRNVSRIGTLGKALILTIAAALLAGAPSALAGTPPSSRCAELLPGGTANTPDPVRAGPAAPLPGSWSPGPRGLPDDVHLRNTTTTYNRLYEFTLAGGDLFARRRSTDERWRQVPLPDCLDGRLHGISADDDEMIGLDGERNVYTMDNALKNPALWNWTKRWGPVMWSGDGFALPANDQGLVVDGDLPRRGRHLDRPGRQPLPGRRVQGLAHLGAARRRPQAHLLGPVAPPRQQLRDVRARTAAASAR